MTIPERVLVAAIVRSKAETPKGYDIELDIASFNSNYPVKVNRVPKQLADQLQVGNAVNVNLLRENLKKNAQGEQKSGNYWTDYYWKLESLAGQESAPAATPAATTSRPPVARVDAPATGVDARDASIRQQVAIKEVGECLRAGTAVLPELVQAYWTTLAGWLGITPAAPGPVSTAALAEDLFGQPAIEQKPVVKNSSAEIGKFLGACNEAGYKMLDVFAALGVKDMKGYAGDLEDAWRIVSEKCRGQ